MESFSFGSKCLGLFILVATILLACAKERDPVDRVQPYALPKSFFIGENFQSVDDDPEFWSQNTVVDMGWGAAQDGLFTSTYVHPLSRIKWQITETKLTARAAYERVEGSDGKGLATGLETQDGIIVAVFSIISHFDIAHAYNPTTGEELNVLEENAVDRPWYEREYIRVDWSRNENTGSYDFDTLSILGVLNAIQYEPSANHVSDPNDEEAPVFDLEDGYFDVTTKVFATPQKVDISHLGWGFDAVPACFFNYDTFHGSYPEGNCNPVELSIRHSFRRTVDNDYEPIEWDGWRFQAFGGFTFIERFGYSSNYGMTDDLHHRFLARYPIWKRHHYYDNPDEMKGAVGCYLNDDHAIHVPDPHRDEDGNGTEDECEAVTGHTGFEGSKCDEFTHKCTLPFRAREQITIPWYFTNGKEEMYFEPTVRAAHEWDVALRGAILSARYSECVKTGGDKATCAVQYPMYFGQQTDNVDAVALAWEMDNCRNQVTFKHANGEQDKCAAEIDGIAKTRGYRAGVADVAKMDEMIVVCHSPVEADDHPSCAPDDARLPPNVSAHGCADARAAGDMELLDICSLAVSARRGDLRHHNINIISEPQTPSPWGIYADAEDPLTGETISASINVWAWYTEYWAQRLVDYLRFAAGELSEEQVTDGEHIRNWSEAAEAMSKGATFPSMTKKEVEERLAEFAIGIRDADLTAQVSKPENLSKSARKTFKQLASGFSGVMSSSKAASTSSAAYSARRQAATNTAFEADLMTPMMQQYYGVGGMNLDNGLMDMVSPLRGGSHSWRENMDALKRSALANHGICELSASEAPVSIAGLGEIMQKKFGAFNPGDPEDVQAARSVKMMNYLIRRAHRSVVVHEMGHSIGLRHNFVSSADPFGYRPQYWQLRTKDDRVKAVCDDLSSDGEDCIGPRYFDPVTKNESDNLIWMWQQSSVMDYAGDASQEILGLGVYDFAATRMFYGDTVAVFADDKYQSGPPNSGFEQGRSLLEKMDDFGGIVGIRFSDGEDDYLHYSHIAEFYDLLRDCHEVSAQAFKPTDYDEETDGAWHPLLDGELVSPEGGKYTRCHQPPVDYVPWTSLTTSPHLNDFLYYRSRNLKGVSRQVDDQYRPRVPYGFASDDWADLGNLSVNLFDNGADPYEIFNFLISQQELFVIFNDYRRGRAWFSVRGAADYNLHRYNLKIRNGAKGLALQRNYMKSFFAEVGWNFNEVWLPYSSLYFRENVLASAMAFDYFARMLARPQVGEHCTPHYESTLRSVSDFAGCWNKRVDPIDDPLGPEEPVVRGFIVPTGAFGTPFGDYSYGGKLVENQLDSSQGEYETQYTLNSGSYYDKMYASMLMTESVDNFISYSRTDFVDKRYRSVSIADLYPEGFRRLLANNLTGDDVIKGVRVASETVSVDDDNLPDTPKIEVSQPIIDSNGYPAQGFGWTSWWGEEPIACFPISGTNVCSHYEYDWDTLTLTNFDMNDAPEQVLPVDPQIDWEQQKFLIAWTLLYLPANQQQDWLNLLRIWELGKDADPNIDKRIEFHNPGGKTYVARTFGTEQIFGKTVQRGIAARVLEYANSLLVKAYETEAVDYDDDGDADWFVAVRDEFDEPIVRYDSTMMNSPVPGQPIVIEGCNETENWGCTCVANRHCLELKEYVEIPFYLRQALDAYNLVSPTTTGVDGN
ncbi:MAG: hypothetical protein GY854_03390 [Deltaproteobacteria bacterium]|nr:hypothetical protein [Deltaproteobacteria bacterium]